MSFIDLLALCPFLGLVNDHPCCPRAGITDESKHAMFLANQRSVL